MPAAKDVGEPGAGEPHARFDEAAGGNWHQSGSHRPHGAGASRRPYLDSDRSACQVPDKSRRSLLSSCGLFLSMRSGGAGEAISQAFTNECVASRARRDAGTPARRLRSISSAMCDWTHFLIPRRQIMDVRPGNETPAKSDRQLDDARPEARGSFKREGFRRPVLTVAALRQGNIKPQRPLPCSARRRATAQTSLGLITAPAVTHHRTVARTSPSGAPSGSVQASSATEWVRRSRRSRANRACPAGRGRVEALRQHGDRLQDLPGALRVGTQLDLGCGKALQRPRRVRGRFRAAARRLRAQVPQRRAATMSRSCCSTARSRRACPRREPERLE
jgi:hypothetical protein